MNDSRPDDGLTPEYETACRLLEANSRVPVFKKFVSDRLTPVSAYLNLSGGGTRPGFLLESVEKGQQLARYSFLGVDPAGEITWKNGEYQLSGKFELDDPSTPFELVDQIMDDWSAPPLEPLPDFTGGLVGYFGYELVHYIEPTVPVKSVRSNYTFPDLYLYLVDRLVIFDHVKRTVYVVGHLTDKNDPKDQYRRIRHGLDRLVTRLKTPSQPPDLRAPDESASDRIDSNFSRREYENAVDEIKDRIRRGEIFQAVLSQRLKIEASNHPFNLYRCLRSLNPSPYMFYLDFSDYQLVGSSPEILVQKEDARVRVRPIAGTRRRGESPEEDQSLARELLSDEKELAEHTMLVDLGRNDLGRVCKSGTVQVTQREEIERYSHVMHIVSNVEGKLSKKYNAVDTLKATFPAGTVTGAPKVRAMKIIESLEPTRRGPYAGAVGYVSYQRNFDTCIVIRTILRENETLFIQAGAGVVADSSPSREYEETREKARALVKSVEHLKEANFL